MGAFTFRRGGVGGFTLIEVLVVVTIMSVLIALLLPSLGEARKTAEQVKCLANLKQQGSGWHAYTLDNKEYIVRALSDIVTESNVGWYASIGNTANGRPYSQYLMDYVAPYDADNALKTSGVWYCAVNRQKGVLYAGTSALNPKSGNYSANGQFGHNERAVGTRNLRLRNIQQNLTQRPIVYDAIVVTGALDRADLGMNVAFRVQEYMSPTQNLERWAHSGNWNMLWGDLHGSREGPRGLASGLFDYDIYGGWKFAKAYAGAKW